MKEQRNENYDPMLDEEFKQRLLEEEKHYFNSEGSFWKGLVHRFVILPAFQGGLTVLLGLEARYGGEDGRFKLEEVTESYKNRGERLPVFLSVARMIAGRVKDLN